MNAFGRTEDGIHTKGLVDAEDSSAFEEKLEQLQDVWDEREQACTGNPPGLVCYQQSRINSFPICSDPSVKLQG